MGQETITLTNAEMKKVLVVEKVLDGLMTNVEAAALLEITPRQVNRLKKKYMQEDDLILWHQGHDLEVKETEKVQRIMETKKASSAQPRKPASSHPWRAWNQKQTQNNIKKLAVQSP